RPVRCRECDMSRGLVTYACDPVSREKLAEQKIVVESVPLTGGKLQKIRPSRSGMTRAPLRSQVVRDLGHRDPEVQVFSVGFSALPVRRKILPLGQNLKTSHRLQSGLRA